MIATSHCLDNLRGCAEKARMSVQWARTVQLSIDTVTWSGDRIGVGIASHSVDVLPKFPAKLLTPKEVGSSGGRFMQGDIRLSQISPPYDSHGGGGYSAQRLNPIIAVGDQRTRIDYLLDGEITGIWVLVALDTSSVTEYTLVLRNSRQTPRPYP